MSRSEGSIDVGAGKTFLYMLGRRVMLEAQDHLCPLCGGLLGPCLPAGHPRMITVEHVWPKHTATPHTSHIGNALLTHLECNNLKADRLPKPCEVLLLFAVNRRLGYSEKQTKRWDQPHVPDLSAIPSDYIKLEELAR